jgi:hypothetical protein
MIHDNCAPDGAHPGGTRSRRDGPIAATAGPAARAYRANVPAGRILLALRRTRDAAGPARKLA